MRVVAFDRLREGVTLDTIRILYKRMYRMFGGYGKLASFENAMLVPMNLNGNLIQPFSIESEARKLENTNFSASGRFKSHTLHDEILITGQQQYSGAAVARLNIEWLRE
jgi:hypothetical protein